MKSQAPKGSAGFPHRGYLVIKEETLGDGTKQLTYNRTINAAGRTNQNWLCFSGMGSQWTGMARPLMAIPTFAESLNACAEALKPLNFDLMSLLLSDDKEELKKNVTNPFVAITAMQIALYDLLCLLDIQFEGIIGHSFGEVACAYADKCLTREQAILTSYWRGKIVESAKLPRGMLAAVGLSWEETIKRCPDGIVAACHNGSDSVTISGLYDNMLKFIDQLKSENVFVRPVAGGDFPYHSPFMNLVAPQLLAQLNRVIPEPKMRSEKWVSTSVPDERQNDFSAKFASGEYFTNNLISPVLFNEGMKQVTKYANVIEVAPHSLFESIFKRCFQSLSYSGLMKRSEVDNLDYFLSSIGQMYCLGINPNIENLYPKVEFPVSRGTQSFSSLIQWDHKQSHLQAFKGLMLPSQDKAATGYLMLAWRRFAAMRCQPWKKTPIVFENVRFFRPTLLSEGNEVKFTVKILDGTGDFTISEGNQIAATGKVYSPEEGMFEFQDQLDEEADEEEDEDDLKEILGNKDIYKELRIRGYDYGPKFQGLVEARGDGKRGKAKWTDHWVSFVDSVMHLALMALPIRTLFIPIGFQRIVCDPNILFAAIEQAKKMEDKEQLIEETKDFFYFNESTRKKYDDKKLGQNSETDEFSTGDMMVNDFGPNLDQNDRRDTSKVISDNIKATLKVGEEAMASEFLGISNLGLEKNPDDEGKVSIVPVGFDLDYRSIYTKGLEIKGFLPVNVPRRPGQQGLILEKYEFVANNEDNAVETADKKSLVEYIQVCCALGQRMAEMSPKVNKLKMNGYKYADEEVVQKYVDRKENSQEAGNHVLLRVINELSALKIDDNSNIIVGKDDKQQVIELAVALKQIFGRPENDITLDYINSMAGNERLIRPSLDLVLENCIDKSLKVLEISPNNNLLAPTIINTMRHSSISTMNFDYTVANPMPSTLPDDLKNLGLKMLEWDLQNSNNFIKEVSSVDLLVFKTNNFVAKHWNLKDQIKSFKDSVKDNGFLLVTYRHVLTPPEIATLELLDRQPKDEILNKSEAENYISIAEKNGFKLVSQKTDSITSSQLLFRKLRQQMKDIEVIHILDEKYDQWVEAIKEIMADNKDADTARNIWLVGNDTALNGIVGLANCLRLESGGQHIRCLFDCDNKLPKAVNFERSPFAAIRQLDLCTNIYRNGQWGSLRHICLPKEQETIATEHRMELHQCSPLYSREATKLRVVFMKLFYGLLLSLGFLWNTLQMNSALNFKDVVLVSGKIQPGPESALFDCIIGLEFAGRRSDTGKRVMGMVPFKGIATTLLTHKDYLWEVPDKWSDLLRRWQGQHI
ncbi:unnamed protein product [Medioppia subpectinata]|uniref:Malonyl-CoA:ACP transacylase (MAT) domain-containing protein n=1 Tax=Medioppia subpectinata TaxID=1979941 RepID=A0A7R9KMG3_9ACAR|nr:unnamed protein product [Medioppia subpectinata]CAG2105236.1 unnamed protein product [Medioppia subpectinata]